MLVSLMVPCYNEEEALPYLYDALCKVMDECSKYEYELIFVNDGSRDKTLSVLKDMAEKDSRVHYISFSRNFGKEAAMYAGLDAAKAIALGADAVGMALPALKGAYGGQEALNQMVDRFNDSLRLAMFLVGADNLEELKNSSLIIKGETREWLEARGIDVKKYARR